MSDMPRYECKKGSTLRIIIDAVTGDLTGATGTMKLKKAVNGGIPGAAAPTAATFAPLYQDSIDGGGPGFYFTLTPTETATLDDGMHYASPRIVLSGGDVVIGDTIQINVKRTV